MSRKKRVDALDLQDALDDTIDDTPLSIAMENAAYTVMVEKHPKLLDVIVGLVKQGDSPSRIAARSVSYGATPLLETLVIMSARHVLRSIKEPGNGK